LARLRGLLPFNSSLGRPAENINAPNATPLEMPSLLSSRDIVVRKATNVDLPRLTDAGYVEADNALNFNAPLLKNLRYINAPKAQVFNAPLLNVDAEVITTAMHKARHASITSSVINPTVM
jgi:hypothetical protein